jgi:hypothetical protein
MSNADVTIHLRLSPDLHRRLALESDAAAARAARVTRSRARAAIRAKDRYRTGHMIYSMGYQRRGGISLKTVYEVGSPLRYMDYQEFGTGPIYPVRAKALRFMPKGGTVYVFARRTKGVPAGRFMREAQRQLTSRDFCPGPGEDLQ